MARPCFNSECAHIPSIYLPPRWVKCYAGPLTRPLTAKWNHAPLSDRSRYLILGSRLGIKEYFYQSWHMYTRGTHSKVASSNCTFHLGPAAKEAKHLWVMSAVKELNAILHLHFNFTFFMWPIFSLLVCKSTGTVEKRSLRWWCMFLFWKGDILGEPMQQRNFCNYNWNQSGIGKKKNLFFSSKQRTV